MRLLDHGLQPLPFWVNLGPNSLVIRWMSDEYAGWIYLPSAPVTSYELKDSREYSARRWSDADPFTFDPPGYQVAFVRDPDGNDIAF